jgi:5-methylcytosine-specific restriction endonuclease McrA
VAINLKKTKHVFRSFEDEMAWYEKYARVRRTRVWKLSEQQNHRCCYCGTDTWIGDGTGEFKYPFEPDRLPHHHPSQKATGDHLIPLSEGGKDALDNMIMACTRCNTKRGVRPAMEFFEAIQSGDPHRVRADKKKYTQEELAEKRSQKDQKTTFWLGYLFVVSPFARCVAKEIIEEITMKMEHVHE